MPLSALPPLIEEGPSHVQLLLTNDWLDVMNWTEIDRDNNRIEHKMNFPRTDSLGQKLRWYVGDKGKFEFTTLTKPSYTLFIQIVEPKEKIVLQIELYGSLRRWRDWGNVDTDKYGHFKFTRYYGNVQTSFEGNTIDQVKRAIQSAIATYETFPVAHWATLSKLIDALLIYKR